MKRLWIAFGVFALVSAGLSLQPAKSFAEHEEEVEETVSTCDCSWKCTYSPPQPPSIANPFGVPEKYTKECKCTGTNCGNNPDCTEAPDVSCGPKKKIRNSVFE